MALTWTDIDGKVNKHIVPRLVDNVYKSSPVLTRLRTRNAERFEGGMSIRHPIVYAKLNGGAFSKGGSFNIDKVQTDTALEIYPKYYYVNISLYGPDNVLARGPEAAMSYVESKMFNASGKMADMLGTDLFLDGQGTNSATTQLDGMQSALDDGSEYATYGGITRTDLGVTAGTVGGINAYNATMATFSMGSFQTAYGSAWFGNEHVDLIATTQAVWDIIWNKLQPQQRFMEMDNDLGKVGFQTLRWNGASIVVDQLCPAGFIYGLNTKYILFYISTVPKYQFGFTGFKEVQNSDDVAGQYLFAGNLLVTAPRLFFKIDSVAA